MDQNMVMQLISNVISLLALSVVYEVSYLLPVKHKLASEFIKGLLISLIGIIVMSIPFVLRPGLVFDTRSILIGVTALMYGTIPTVVVVVVASVYRIIQGGVGIYVGLAVIVTSATIGLLWQKFVLKQLPRNRWFNTYLFGLTLHIAMLLCMFLLPTPLGQETLRIISVPILVLYPVGTVVLTMLILRQKERTEAMMQVSEANGRYKSLFFNNHAAILLSDPSNGKIVDANAAASQFYGWPVAKLKEMVISDINTIPRHALKEAISGAIDGIENHFFFQQLTASGHVVDVEVYGGPIKFAGRTLIYSITRDVSERVAAEKALHESESRFRMVVQGAPDAIFIFREKEGRFSFLNQAALRLFGADTEDQLLGTLVMDRIHPSFRKIVQDRMNSKEAPPPSEEIFLKLDGTLVNVEVTAVRIGYQEQKSNLVFVRDITERKKMDESRVEMDVQLRQHQKLEAIGTLAGGVAHEINNPLNGIMNYAQLILDMDEQTQASGQYAEEIIHETERISEIVKSLLQFSRQEKQTHSYAEVTDIIDQTISLIRTIIKKDQIQLIIELEPDLPAIKCRSQQIQQVLMNILINAK
ncbi:MAG: PAS domain S-box protein, partial [Firmicutes bacterium]|nr:PAS domain S-box protein [Bacillota bacterium]